MVTIVTNERNNSLFNQKVKNDFLNDMIESGNISEESAKSYARIFSISFKDEEALDKDLNQFSFEELEAVLINFKANNRNTIESYGRIISSYLNWCVAHKLISKNLLGDLKPDDFENYLTNEEVYFTDKKLRRYEDQCKNYQDAVILRLLFMGVGGRKMSEIRNLKKDDVDPINKTLRLINTLTEGKNGMPKKFTERTIKIDDRTLELIEGAKNEKKYEKKNGDMKEVTNIRPYTDLVSSDYILRASITKTENFNAPVDKFVIYRRIQTIADSLEIGDLTAKYIQRSGMIFHASKLVQDGELSLDDLKIVADRFNLKSYHNLKGILTVENIEKTYQKQ